jgi:hypothetical protein
MPSKHRDNVVPFGRKTYAAKVEKLTVSGLDLHIAGTLDGFIDFAVIPANRPGLTYSFTCDEARRIVSALTSVIADVKSNCLFDRDTLLEGITRR